VAHFLAFGPIIAVLPLVLRRTANLLASWGPGAVLFTVLSLATLISPESRHGVLGYPFLAVAVMIAFEKTGKVHSSLVWGLAAASLVMSRVWQRFDTGLVDSRGAPDVSRYFATQGMQLPNWDYLMGLFVLVTMAMAVAGSMPSRGPGASMVRASSANPRCSDGEAATTPEEAAADPEA
jgi:hypothetical protein